MSFKIAHIINPVKVEAGNPSYLDVAQPVTFRSMLNAQALAKKEGIEVDLYTTQYPEDHSIIPEGFNKTPDLLMSVHNYIKLKNKSKKLPRVIDIIKRLYENSDADYFVFTDADIGLFPNFYKWIYNNIKNGIKSFTITRKTLPKIIDGVVLNENTLELIYKQKGKFHPGYDCFVFPRHFVPKMNLGNVFVGYPPVGTAILNELQRLDNKFIEYKYELLTFHLGDDKPWSRKANTNEYFRANIDFAKRIGVFDKNKFTR